MIYNVQRSRLGLALCSDPYGTLSYLNPACWSQWAQDNSPAKLQEDCSRAAGGSITSDLYKRCIGQTAANLEALAKMDPQGAEAYAGVTGPNPFGYVFGVTNPDGSPNLPSPEAWIMLAIAAAAGIFLLVELRR